MTAARSDLAVVEHRGISTTATARLAAASSGGTDAAARPLNDAQRTYLDRLLVDSRAAAEQRSALDERLARRDVRAIVAMRLADALLAEDTRTVETFLPVYAVAVEGDDATRPAAQLRAV